MTNEEIVKGLHKMVDVFGKMLDNTMLEGTLPILRIACKPDQDGDRLTLIVGAEFASGDDE